MRGRFSAVALTVIMVLTIGLMMLAPASAGAFPGRNGMIAFDAPVNRISQIFLMNPDGSGLQQITYGNGAANPVWSADGTKIAYVNQNHEVWVMKADGTGAYKVTGPNSYYPSWSPDGMKIAYHNSTDSHLWFMSADGTGTPTQLTTGLTYDDYPSWSPDGSKIAFSRDGHLAVLTLATLSVTVLLPNTFSSQPCWSPDGSMIVFVGAGNVAMIEGDIDVVSANGGTPTSIQKGSFAYPDWSPDGTKIVASRGDFSIYIMNADGSGTPTELTPASMFMAEDPNFQPLPVHVIPEYPFGLALLAVFMIVAYGVIRRRRAVP
jgi:Tol biopolymer transport system component